jgi:DNA repair protein RecN (Recombination protein N)
MLVELRIRDFAVIRDLSVELGPGLNVLSGETGAGKSIIVGALSLLLGERASSESVRTGARRALVEAVFDISSHPGLRGRLEELGLPDEGDLVILRREVQAEGRNRAWINGSPATAGSVGELGRDLVDLHGQHDHQTLLRPDEQRAILDAFAGSETLAGEVSSLHGRLSQLVRQREERESRTRELAARADFLRFQLAEIDEARPLAGEDREVEDELRRLDHAEELAREAEAVHQALYGEEGAASEILALARDRLRRLTDFDSELATLRDLVESLYHQVVEAGRSAGSYAESVELDSARAEALRRRAERLFRLKRKYGPELDDVFAARARLEEELKELDGAGLAREELDRELEKVKSELGGRAGLLTRARADAALGLADDVRTLLPELGMPGALFEVALSPLPETGPGGAERVELLASLNPGFDPRPLARIASGGEFSRVMLALKTVLAKVDRVPTLVFDEVDAGIGGTVAVSVAQKLAQVADDHQVLVITHLPQLASRAGRHLRVEKSEEDGMAEARVTPLEGEERVREIARMLGGDPGSATSRDHARELLLGARPA